MSMQKLDEVSVHRICSGQVVTDLATAMKELVENAVDAKCSRLEIRLINYGAESIQVVDNGTGISPADYESIALKYHTSKIEKFEDLHTVDSLGFRGEALSSICALAGSLVIETRTKDEDVAARLHFDANGSLIKQESCSRDIGTTVTVSDLFKRLPVRFREFRKHCKREYGKALQLIQAYAIINERCRISCTNQVNIRAKKSTVLSTRGSNSIRGNISAVFGSKQSRDLMGIDLKLSDGIRVTGFVSKVGDSSSNRSTGDRQYVYLNHRPVVLKQFTKVLNSVYKTYCTNRFPLCVLDIHMPAQEFDVNITPDKRTCFLHKEKELIESFSNEIERIYDPEIRELKVQNSQLTDFGFRILPKSSAMSRSQSSALGSGRSLSTSSSQHTVVTERIESQSSAPSAIEESHQIEARNPTLLSRKTESKAKTIPAISALDSFAAGKSRSMSNDIRNRKRDRNESLACENDNISKNSQRARSEVPDFDVRMQDRVEELTEGIGRNSNEPTVEQEFTEISKKIVQDCDHRELDANEVRENMSLDEKSVCEEEEELETIQEHIDFLEEKNTNGASKDESMNDESDRRSVCRKSQLSDDNDRVESEKTSDTSSVAEDDERMKVVEANTNCTVDESVPSKNSADGKITAVDVSLDEIMKISKMKATAKSLSVDFSRACPLTDTNKLTEYGGNQEWTNIIPDDEMRRTLRKQDFLEFEILGQFNLGFIIARFREDLYIIDQHASHEKFNYERYRRKMEVRKQSFICPKPLDVTADVESIILDNLNVFEKHGFDLEVDMNKPPARRVALTAAPSSRKTILGTEDIEQLAEILQKTPTAAQLCHLPRLNAIYASRACRTSVMIGDALSTRQMKKIVHDLANLDQPWNCPHGRPTIRHLFSLKALAQFSTRLQVCLERDLPLTYSRQ